MVQEHAGSLRLEVSGPSYHFDPPPDGLPFSVLQRTTSRGFDGQAILSLVLAVDWIALASGVGLNLFSQWLYDSFKRPDRDEAAFNELDSRVEIKIYGNVNIVVLTDPQAFEATLRKLVNER
jgi:hypothetical protein